MTEGIIVALIMGGFSLVGIIYSARKTQNKQESKQDATIEKIQAENKASLELVKEEFKSNCALIMEKIKQLEKKQDKHNGLIEKVYKVEARLDELDKK